MTPDDGPMIKYLGSKRRLVPVLTRDLPGLGRPHGARPLHRHHPRRPGLQGAGHARHRRRQRSLRPRLRPHLHRGGCRRHRRGAAPGGGHPPQRLPGKPGYVTETFSRQARFFQPHNAARIDAVRDAIDSEYAGSPLFPLLLTSLIEAADRVDSTTGVQMAYVKQWAPRSFNPLELRVPELLVGAGGAIQGDAVALAPPSWGTSTWRTSIRRTTSTGTSPTTTCGRRWSPGMRPRPTAWPASGWTRATHPHDLRSTRSGRCRPRWPRWSDPWTATCWCCPTTTSPGSSWTSSRRCARSASPRRYPSPPRLSAPVPQRETHPKMGRSPLGSCGAAGGGDPRLRLDSIRRGPDRHLQPIRAQGRADQPPVEPGVAGHRR